VSFVFYIKEKQEVVGMWQCLEVLPKPPNDTWRWW